VGKACPEQSYRVGSAHEDNSDEKPITIAPLAERTTLIASIQRYVRYLHFRNARCINVTLRQYPFSTHWVNYPVQVGPLGVPMVFDGYEQDAVA
jgi:hypothetical protein